jgi:hypothetical protein
VQNVRLLLFRRRYLSEGRRLCCPAQPAGDNAGTVHVHLGKNRAGVRRRARAEAPNLRPSNAGKQTTSQSSALTTHANVTVAMEILAANDQENLAHAFQAAAAAKPLNAGLKGFNAKTPGNKAPKTPFKIPLNDENAFKGGKTGGKAGGKGDGNLFMTMKKGGNVDNNAFVTPAGEFHLMCFRRESY